jgi:hypothetical protein
MPALRSTGGLGPDALREVWRAIGGADASLARVVYPRQHAVFVLWGGHHDTLHLLTSRPEIDLALSWIARSGGIGGVGDEKSRPLVGKTDLPGD